MAARTASVAFHGAEARLVDVQVQVAGGSQPIFSIVGLADKAVAESRERVRAAFSANWARMLASGPHRVPCLPLWQRMPQVVP